MTDVDLLVPPAKLADARRAMRAAGWTMLTTPGRPLGSRIHRAFSASSAQGVIVDVHGHVAQRMRWPMPMGELLVRAIPFTLGRRLALRPSNEDSILIAALNEAKDEFPTTGCSIEDIARLAARGDLDWKALVERTRRYRASVAIWVALERARAQYSAAVPAWVLGELRPRRAAALAFVVGLGGQQRPSVLGGSRRLRQTVVGPLLTDSPSRFLVSAVGWAMLRAADAVVARTGLGSSERAPGTPDAAEPATPTRRRW